MRAPLAVLLALATPTTASAGPCARRDATSLVLSAADIDVPADGGILVGSTTIGLGSQGGAADAMNPSWRFHDEVGGEHVPTLVALAPGLVSYRPPAEAIGRLRLASGSTELISVRRVTTEQAVLDAPKVRRIRARGSATVTIELATKAPSDAVAVVVLAATRTGNVARSWAAVSGGETSIIAYQAPGTCEPKIPGAKPSRAGERVAIAWVDRFGRLSKSTAVLKVSN